MGHRLAGWGRNAGDARRAHLQSNLLTAEGVIEPKAPFIDLGPNNDQRVPNPVEAGKSSTSL